MRDSKHVRMDVHVSDIRNVTPSLIFDSNMISKQISLN